MSNCRSLPSEYIGTLRPVCCSADSVHKAALGKQGVGCSSGDLHERPSDRLFLLIFIQEAAFLLTQPRLQSSPWARSVCWHSLTQSGLNNTRVLQYLLPASIAMLLVLHGSQAAQPTNKTEDTLTTPSIVHCSVPRRVTGDAQCRAPKAAKPLPWLLLLPGPANQSAGLWKRNPCNTPC